MMSFSLRVMSIAGLALFAVACGSSKESAPLHESVDDIDLAAPASPEQGWQFLVPAFSVPTGAEVQQCFLFKVPYDQPVFVNHITMAQTTGTHHMNVFRVKTIQNLDGEDGARVVDGECWNPTNWSDWPLVINSQNEGRVDVQLPDGVAHRFEPGEKLMLQTHYVNATTQTTPGIGKVFVNFDRIDASSVTAELGTAFATNQNIRICPGDVDRTFETTCRFAHGPVTIFGANGHFHSRGRSFTMSVFNPDPDAAIPAPFYESTRWDEPVFVKSLDVAVPDQGGIHYTCEYTVGPNECGNPGDGCCFTFGGKVDSQEHCNAFVYYYPHHQTDTNCF
jgi:hypothetical protein